MGKKGNWFSAVKKALSPDSRDKNAKKSNKSKKTWFGRQRSLDLESPPTEASPPKEEVKLAEAEKEQSKHAFSMAFASIVAAGAAVAAAHAAAEVVRLTGVASFYGKTREETAAIKIQTAFRGYLARRALRALKGLVRLKSLIERQSVKRQATNTLKCMQTLARVQSQIHARRMRMSEENNLALQRQNQQKHDNELEKLTLVAERWDDSSQTKEQIEASQQNKQEAAMKRERALAYAYSRKQIKRNTSKSATSSTFMDPNSPHWCWSWLERRTASRPWESKNTVDREPPDSDHAPSRSTTNRAISVEEISRAYLNNKPSSTAKKHRRSQSHSTPTSKVPTSSVGKMKLPSSKESVCGQIEQQRRHSIGGESSIKDDKGIGSSSLPAEVPNYDAAAAAAAAKSTKPKTTLQGSIGIEMNAKGSASGSSKRRISFPSSSSPSQTTAAKGKHSGPLKLETSSAKDVQVNS